MPDSVLRFDLEFDYSVSDSPYKGAYEFSPYTLDMKPSPAYRDIRTFYLKAGAGYQLHPVFDAVWSPFVKGPFRMNIYALNRSFIGNYWTMAEPSSCQCRHNKDSYSGRCLCRGWRKGCSILKKQYIKLIVECP